MSGQVVSPENVILMAQAGQLHHHALTTLLEGLSGSGTTASDSSRNLLRNALLALRAGPDDLDQMCTMNGVLERVKQELKSKKIAHPFLAQLLADIAVSIPTEQIISNEGTTRFLHLDLYPHSEENLARIRKVHFGYTGDLLIEVGHSVVAEGIRSLVYIDSIGSAKIVNTPKESIALYEPEEVISLEKGGFAYKANNRLYFINQRGGQYQGVPETGSGTAERGYSSPNIKIVGLKYSPHQNMDAVLVTGVRENGTSYISRCYPHHSSASCITNVLHGALQDTTPQVFPREDGSFFVVYDTKDAERVTTVFSHLGGMRQKDGGNLKDISSCPSAEASSWKQLGSSQFVTVLNDGRLATVTLDTESEISFSRRPWKDFTPEKKLAVSPDGTFLIGTGIYKNEQGKTSRRAFILTDQGRISLSSARSSLREGPFTVTSQGKGIGLVLQRKDAAVPLLYDKKNGFKPIEKLSYPIKPGEPLRMAMQECQNGDLIGYQHDDTTNNIQFFRRTPDGEVTKTVYTTPADAKGCAVAALHDLPGGEMFALVRRETRLGRGGKVSVLFIDGKGGILEYATFDGKELHYPKKDPHYQVLSDGSIIGSVVDKNDRMIPIEALRGLFL